MIQNIGQRIFDPPTIATKTTYSVKNAKFEAPSYSLRLPGMDGYVMARRSKFNTILADTSQGKTSVLSIMARNFADQLDIEKDEIGMYFTWEDTIEEFGMSDISHYSKIPLASLYHGDVKEYEYKRMLRAAVERAKLPLWVVGQSETVTQLQPRLTMTDVFAAVDYVTNTQNKKVKFVMLDYLQRISFEDIKERDTRMKYSGIVDKIKDLALSYHPCTWTASQVSRDKVEKHKWRQPQIHWGMETANLEHASDGAISLWMPHKSKDVWKDGDCLQEKQGIDGKAVFVEKTTMLIEILKQKKADTGHVQALDFIPEYNMLVEYGTADIVRKEIKQTYIKDAIIREDE